ncbi:MAG TPA: TetR/AcrR family transcriptional regulator [Acidimicrobiales bacterium]
MSGRAAEIVATARVVLEAEGADALTMRRLGDELGMKAPSLYKHFDGKAAIELVLVEEALLEMGEALRSAIDGLRTVEAVEPLLRAYRRTALDHPSLYRLATLGPLPREGLTPGVEDWAGEPFLLVMGEPHLAQAVWSAAHGMVSLELDGRYPPGSDLDRTWTAAASAFGRNGNVR